MEQKSFLADTWKIGNRVFIGDRQGVIKRFSPKGDKVHVEYRDALEGETYLRWHKIGELPPYTSPAADMPLHVPTEEDLPEFAAGYRAVGNGGTGPVLEVLYKQTDGTYLCEVTLTSGKPFTTQKTAQQVEKWGVAIEPKMVDEPKPEIEPEPETDASPTEEEEITFEKGHKRVQPDGSTLVIHEPSVRGKYMCRIFLAKGGTRSVERTWQEIAAWGEPVAETDDKSVDPMAVAAAVKDAMDKAIEPATDVPLHVPTEEDRADNADVVPTANPDVKRRRELKCEMYTVRSRDKFDMEGASARLTALVNDGWQLQHIEHQTIWIPAKSNQEQSYVETTVFWTLDRVVEIS